MKFINSYKSQSYNYRKKNSTIKLIVIHYTAIKSYKEAINYLCDKKNKVSCHFLVNRSGIIFSLVEERFRAWHAGVSKWKKINDINSNSIGIELVNSGHHLDFEEYGDKQISSLIELVKYLQKKYKILPINILGHSEVAPYRKIDPGEKFPWFNFEKKNLIKKYEELNFNKNSIIDSHLKKKSLKLKKEKILFMLNQIGYDIYEAKLNNINYIKLIKVFQMRYRSNVINGKFDLETYAILQKIYFNQFLTS